MAAPPMFGVAHFRQNQIGIDGVENILRQHGGDHRLRAADMQIEILHAGLGFADQPLHHRAAARRHELSGDAVTPGKRDLHELA